MTNMPQEYTSYDYRLDLEDLEAEMNEGIITYEEFRTKKTKLHNIREKSRLYYCK